MFDDHHTSRIVYDNTLPAVLQHLENGWPLRFNDDWWATAEVDLRQWLNAAIDLLEAGIDVRPQDDILKTLEAALGPRFEGSDIPWVHFLGLVDHFEDHIIVISDDEEPKTTVDAPTGTHSRPISLVSPDPEDSQAEDPIPMYFDILADCVRRGDTEEALHCIAMIKELYRGNR